MHSGRCCPPDHVAPIAGDPDDGCLSLKGDKAKAPVLCSVHSVSGHVDIHDIPAQQIEVAKPASVKEAQLWAAECKRYTVQTRCD